MDPGDEDGFVEELCDVHLDAGWEHVIVESANQNKDQAAAMQEYILQQMHEMRPTNADFTDFRRFFPIPCMQPGDSPLLRNPLAWACQHTQVLYVIWHFVSFLRTFWRNVSGKDNTAGMPPCPKCWQHTVQVADDRQLTVQQCYTHLTDEELVSLQSQGKLGTVGPHGWPHKSYYRCGALGQPVLVKAFQYKCKKCPGELPGSKIKMHGHACYLALSWALGLLHSIHHHHAVATCYDHCLLLASSSHFTV